MARYNLEVVDIHVHRWGPEGQGEYVCTKGGFTVGGYPTLDEAKAGASEFLGYTLDEDDYYGDHITGNILEDVDAYADPDGDYIANYTMRIDKIDRVRFNDYDE